MKYFFYKHCHHECFKHFYHRIKIEDIQSSKKNECPKNLAQSLMAIYRQVVNLFFTFSFRHTSCVRFFYMRIDILNLYIFRCACATNKEINNKSGVMCVLNAQIIIWTEHARAPSNKNKKNLYNLFNDYIIIVSVYVRNQPITYAKENK